MNNYILGTATVGINDINMMQPEFRNTSRNMVLAHTALGRIFSSHDSLLEFLKQNTTGIFVGTSHGELQCSSDFLRYIEMEGLARPILFQNSLHNSILGFVTKAYGLTGPSFTISSQHFSGEDALCLACDVLDSQMIQYALVVGVDTIPSGIEDIFYSTYKKDVKLVEGAGAVLLTNKQNLSAISDYIRPKAIIRDVKCNKTKAVGTTENVNEKGYYDSNAIEKLCKAVETNIARVDTEKPDGSSSVLSLGFE
ncbi:MAG: beta-ketoacyl synthase N-terminal-like domain-containing protein [Proteobacteria bacterium]|nr:beta-ketoacyl synthase N-terminal-like domain-containing protein [Pseudomonadota bacterium]